MNEKQRSLFQECSSQWTPPPKLTLSQWADMYRRLSPEASSQTGQWKTSTAEYQRGVLDAFTDPHVHTIVVMSATQLLKSEVILNAIGYVIHIDPGPILLVVPRETDGDTFSKDRLAPMLRDTPALHGRVADAKSRDSGNTVSHKIFPGGHFTIAGAISPSGLAARPIRYLFCDEIDKYPASAGTEGDPISLADKRTATFWNRKKILACSPTIEGASRIDKAFQTSDQRRFNVPCPKCGTYQELIWQQVIWNDTLPATEQAASARYKCQHCGYLWNDVERWRSIKKGRWVAHAAFGGIAGFHINEIYSPWKKLSALVQDFLEKKDDQEQLKTFINTSLAETWKEKGEAPDWQRLYERRDSYQIGLVPRGCLFLTAGADVQKDRIEIQIIGWGRGKENWSIDHLIIEGETSGKEIWAKLDLVLESRWQRVDGGPEMALSRFAIDSGYATNEVYTWVRSKGPGRVIAVKGMDRSAVPVGQPTAVDIKKDGKKIARGCRVWPVATGILKSELYGWLRLQKPTAESGRPFPPGYCHHPQYQEEYFKQLTAEQLVTRINRNRYKKQEWQKTRDRNEALDTWVYARAAAAQFGIDRFREHHWRGLEEAFPVPLEAPPIVAVPVPVAPLVPPPVAPARPSVSQSRRGAWLGDRRGWLR